MKEKLTEEEQKERNRINQKKYELKNKEKRAARKKELQQENKEKIKEYNRKRYLELKEILTEEEKNKKLETAREWKNKNKEKTKEYYLSNIEKIKESQKKWRNENKEKRKEYRKQYSIIENINRKEKRETNPLYKLTCNIRKNINNAIKSNGYTKESRTHEILGCSYEQFKEYIENQFESWMSWDNYGNPKDRIYELNKSWDIDHIIPIASYSNEQELLELNHYTNLRPLCSYYNRFVKRDNL
jgi:hypothetical protein